MNATKQSYILEEIIKIYKVIGKSFPEIAMLCLTSRILHKKTEIGNDGMVMPSPRLRIKNNFKIQIEHG